MGLALKGDKSAYERLLETIAGMVRGYLVNTRSTVAATAEAREDLVQDVLVAVHRKKHLYQAGRPLLPWIFAIARYRLVDRARAVARRPAEVPWEPVHEPPAREEGLGRALELEKLLEGLTDRQRQTVLLAKMEGLPLAEVGKKLGLSLAAVKVTLHRARAALRKRLQKEDHENR